ncbi:MAG: peptidylprolyl isomerase [Nanoarchaeota archaeon]
MNRKLMKVFSLGILVVVLLTVTLFLSACGGEKMNRSAVIETNLGTIKIELFEKQMPITTKNFIDLAEKDFYDNTKFHRVISRFMIQGGDPLTKENSKKYLWGTGGPGYVIDDEFATGLSNVRGTIAMANAGPDTGGSQFFINLVNNNFLDSKHPVFGKVIEGMDVVDKIAATETDGQDKPVEDVIVKKISIQ